MDMNAFRKHLAQRTIEQGEDNKPRHRAFGADLDNVNTQPAYNRDLNNEETVEAVNENEDSRGVQHGLNIAHAADKRKPKKPTKGKYITKSGETVYSTGLNASTDNESLTGRDILEAFEIVNFFCESIMEEHGLNEESEDIDAIIEEALNLLDLDEDYGKMPTVSQGLSDDEKKKVQKGEKSQMPTAGVEDKLPGEQQSSIDAIKAVLGSKKGSAAGSAY